MTYATLTLERDSRDVCTLCLNRPEVHNVMNLEMIRELRHALGALADSPPRVLVLTGAGGSFCAGGDLRWMRDIAAQEREQRIAESAELADMLAVLDTLPVPVIGRVNGQAFGGGLGLISCCDLAVGVEGARFALTEVRLGLIPSVIGPYVIAAIGISLSKETVAQVFTVLLIIEIIIPDTVLIALVARDLGTELPSWLEFLASDGFLFLAVSILVLGALIYFITQEPSSQRSE